MSVSMLRVLTCVTILLMTSNIHAKSTNEDSTSNSRSSTNTSTVNQNAQRRQDGGFDFMNYFMGNSAQQQQQEQQVPQQQSRTPQQQQPLTVQQQHLLQLQQLQQHQNQQQEQLKLLQQQQLHELQQQQRSPDLQYQDNNAIQYHQPQQQQQAVALNRDGGYGGIGIGNAYPGGDYAKPREIGINLGGGKKVIEVGNILTLLPRVFNVLNAGGKVMFGVELGNNFYFGPVGAKPLGKALG